MTPLVSVIIPAHNESAVLGRLLHELAQPPLRDSMEIIVVANGCTDDTARVAGSVHDSIRVLDIAEGSKTAALNAGDRHATVFPRVYVDADVLIAQEAVLELAATLSQPGAFIASPRLIVETAGASWAVKQHYRLWELTHYRRTAHIGSGVYALSRAGRERFADWPPVIADDRFVQLLFSIQERRTLSESVFVVHSPRTLRAQLRRAVRIARGNRELAEMSASSSDSGSLPGSSALLHLLTQVAGKPSLWPGFVIYAVTNLTARIWAEVEIRTHRPRIWHRDDTTRTADD
ncbi:MAG: glycosyltransferase [Micropruina sp.]|nr:glycosyltransferase [Micropruina sp.]